MKEATRNKYDIFILDVMLPFKDGFEIAKEIRKNEIQTPIIFLTAKEDLQSKEIGFNV
ncbi:MAG: response regulator [Candidatus Peribacteria bacterium]|nr:response regulator [Candidatus Peribacteria bacterium]